MLKVFTNVVNVKLLDSSLLSGHLVQPDDPWLVLAWHGVELLPFPSLYGFVPALLQTPLLAPRKKV